MKAELIEDVSRVAAIEGPWRALAESRGNAFVTPEWFRSWADHSPDSVRPLVVAVRRQGGELAGVMPLVHDATRRPRTISFAGAKFGDRFAPAASAEDESEVAAAAMTAIRERSMLVLDHVDPQARWWRAMEAVADPPRARIEQQQAEAPYIELSGLDWDAYVASRSKNFRSQLRRRERKLFADYEVEIRTPTEASLDEDLSEFFALHALRWQSRQGRSSLEATGAKEQIRSFAAAAQRQGWLRLRLLRVDGTPAAAFLGWRIGPVYSFYQSGFDPRWSHTSVGIVLMATTIRSAIEEGASEFDMLLGDEAYKHRFTNASRPLQTVVLTRKGPAQLLMVGEAAARRVGGRLAERESLNGFARAVARRLPSARRF
jgi:CelD/BcsL family acetyltransferase involved in cellulose biosynthesis